MAISRRSTALLAALLTSLFMLAAVATANAAVSFDSPVYGDYINDTTPTIAYTGAPASSAVDLLNLDNDVIASSTSDADGNGTVTPAAAINSTPRERVLLQLDDGAQRPSVVLHVDWTPDFSQSPGAPVNADELTLTAGQAIPDRPVRLYIDDQLVSTETADADGEVTTADGYTDMAPHDLAAGPHTAYLTSVDAAGVESSHSPTLDFDIRPSAPAFTDLFDNVQLNQSSPAVDFHAVDQAADKVTLYELDHDGNLVTLGETTDISSGTASITPTLSDGTHYLVATQTVDGIESDPNMGSVTTIVNTSAPVLDGPDAVTYDQRPWFDAANVLDGDNSQLVLYIDGQEAGRDSGFGGDEDSLQPTNPLTSGPHSAYVVTVDDLGHQSAVPSNTVTFTVNDAPVDDPATGPQSGSEPTAEPPAATPVVPPAVVPAPVPPVLTPTMSAPSKVALSSHVLTAKRPVKVSFVVAKPATIKLTIAKTVKGKTTTVATVSVKVKRPGKGSYLLKAKVGHKTLAKGSYTVSLQAVSPAKGVQRPSKTVGQTLTVR